MTARSAARPAAAPSAAAQPGTLDRETFTRFFADHRVIPVTREVFADTLTPTGVYRALAHSRPGTFLLESAEQGGIWSRFSFVGVASFGVLTEEAGRSLWLDYGLDAEAALGPQSPQAPLEALQHLHERWRTPRVAGVPPLAGGLVGFIGWEAVRQLEHLPDAPPADHAVPGQALCFVSDLVVIDHHRGTAQMVATVLAGRHRDADAAWRSAQRRLDALQDGLARPVPAALAEIDLDAQPQAASHTPKDAFLAAVERSKDYVRRGDVFQVVVSQRFEQHTAADPLDVYRVLRTLNPSPYMYLLSLERPDGTPYTVVGSSPEALVKIQGSRVYTHPIAGSRPRGATPDEDGALERELRADPKERAEHLMLVDLARNDLSRVCVPGTVEVTEFMRVERFSHIMHLVSSVEGELPAGVSPVDVLRAAFPAGTLSGAPKPRALQIIDELEPVQRGVYGGVVGYFDFAGDADLAIAIRTATLVDGMALVQAGAGLVADSDPETEYRESQNKAAAPLRAVAVAATMHRID